MSSALSTAWEKATRAVLRASADQPGQARSGRPFGAPDVQFLDHMLFVDMGDLVRKDRRKFGLILHLFDGPPGHEYIPAGRRIGVDLLGVQDREMKFDLRPVGVLNKRLADQIDIAGQLRIVIQAETADHAGRDFTAEPDLLGDILLDRGRRFRCDALPPVVPRLGKDRLGQQQAAQNSQDEQPCRAS